MRLLRNSLEHLDEAELTDFEAMSGHRERNCD
jgi:hypothetical protein